MTQAASAGQWVALAAERLLRHGPDARQVSAAAHAAGVAVPVVAYIEAPDEGQWGGWLSRNSMALHEPTFEDVLP
jgi:hypothetical protein